MDHPSMQPKAKLEKHMKTTRVQNDVRAEAVIVIERRRKGVLSWRNQKKKGVLSCEF